MQEKKKRIFWVDAIKVIGIFLIYYAHVLQKVSRESTEAIFFQYKLIYAFHMPLFFFMSGFFFKKRELPTLAAVGLLFQKRIFPVLLFVFLSATLFLPYLYLKFGAIAPDFFSEHIGYLFEGKPHINATLWFLVCLFLVEIWALLLLPKIKTKLQGILLAAAFLYFGYLWTAAPNLESFYILPKNFWYIHESLVAFGFYALGYTTFRWMERLTELSLLTRVLLIPPLAWILAWSTSQNTPFKNFIIIMKSSEHGNFHFFLSALSGILLTILLASLIPENRLFKYIGKNTLILLGTNGFFISFFNAHIVSWLNHQHSTMLMTFDAIWISLLTIGISIPVIEILNRWLPQLVGNPQAEGPLLKAFSPPKFQFLEKGWGKISDFLGTIKE